MENPKAKPADTLYRDIQKTARELMDTQNHIKDLKNKEASLKFALINYLKKGNLSGGDFYHLNKKYRISLVESKYNTPLSEKEKIDGIEMALISIGDMKLDDKSKSQFIHNKLKENVKNKVKTNLKISKIK